MNGRERRQMLLQAASANGSVSTRKMAQRFGVSRMTIHRDLQILAQAGQLKRIHGGGLPLGTEPSRETSAICPICGKQATSHQQVVKYAATRQQKVYCCAVCALKALLQDPDYASCNASDLISGSPLPLTEAYFIIRSSATPCCQPSILTFASELDAANFRSGFGGVAGRLDEALAFLHTELNLNRSG